MLGLKKLDYPDFGEAETDKDISLQSSALPDFHPTGQQQSIIAKALQLNLPVLHLEGPPGTGKSTLSALAANAILKTSEDARILVCAPSHKAADHVGTLLHRIQEGGDSPIRVLRIYSPTYEEIQATSAVPYALHNLAMVEDPSYPEEIKELQSSIRQRQESLKEVEFVDIESGAEQTAIFQEACKNFSEMEQEQDRLYGLFIDFYKPNVIVTTCMGTGDQRLQDAGLPFSHVFLDEVGQALLPEAIFAISRQSLEGAKQVFLVGDRHQLPPVVLSTGAVGVLLETCLPASLEEGKILVRIRLIWQFRMHPAILEFPNGMTYNNELKSAITAAARNLLCDLFPFPKHGYPRVFCTLVGDEDHPPGHVSRRNALEAEWVVKIYRFLLAQGLDPAQIAILTFYDAQRQYIIVLLHRAGLPSSINGKPVVANVDNFQGQERDVIILSCVRSTSKGNWSQTVGFLAKYNRPNVAITRAKCGLIVLGNPFQLMIDPYWRKFILSFVSVETLIHDTAAWFNKFTTSAVESWYNDAGYIRFPEPTAQQALVDKLDRAAPGWREGDEVVDEYVGEEEGPAMAMETW